MKNYVNIRPLTNGYIVSINRVKDEDNNDFGIGRNEETFCATAEALAETVKEVYNA